MASWHDGSVCSRIDLFYSEELATCLSCGSSRDHPYVYEPIKQRSEIRLLKIQPGEGDNPIRGELIKISTNSQHDYDAVSYTWADENGDVTRRFRAFIGTGYVLITRSCQKVLQRIRSRFHTNYVWIDSLCVDQDNLQERGHQVDLMPLIYTRAKKTYVYIGPTTTKDEETLEALASWRVEHDWNADEEPFWVTLNNFLRRPYFFRVWIMQEIALSPNAVILGGEKEYPWSILQNDTALHSLFGHLDQALEKGIVPPLLSLGKRRLRGSAELPVLLRLSRHCQATDHRDRVFALLGLVIGAEAENLVADYGRTTPEVFTWIARYLANTGTAADTLGNLNISQDPTASGSLLEFQHRLQLPSWVPDWTNAGMTFLNRFPEARTFLKNIRFQLHKQDMTMLILTGFIVGYSAKPLSLDQFRRAMLLRSVEPESQFVLFQVAQRKSAMTLSGWNTSGAFVPRFLIILLRDQTNTELDLEALSWRPKDFQDFGTFATAYERECIAFRFIGLLDTESVKPSMSHFHPYQEKRRLWIT